MIVYNKINSKYISRHIKDMYTDLGYDYRHSIFKKSVSKILFQNKNVANFLEQLQKPIVFLIDAVKQIRLQYMISLDKKDRNLN